ncbi:MAG: ComEC/Rec2 family competence protein [Sphingobium sp.]
MVALGIGMWFALPQKTHWMAWIGLCCTLTLLALRLPRGGRLRSLLICGILIAAAGCILIWAKAIAVWQPPLERPVFTRIEGRVLAVEPQPARNQVRLMLQPTEGRRDLPARLRVNVSVDDLPEGAGPGGIVAFRARLMPPAPPAVPGAYDFATRAYFMGIGATGRALAPIDVIQPSQRGGIELRARLADHIGRRLPGPEGAIAVTLATGDRGRISDEDAEAMRRSGLAHLLSISGLHVSALIGTVIFVIYRLLALSPRLALSLPLMLIAAGGGALAGIAYTLFTGAQVPTVRACIAALLVLGALAVGREAISLRLVAVGALVVLIIWPESLVGPSFQMSFAAVTVIIALAEARWFRALTHARDETRLRKSMRAVLALLSVGLAVELVLTPVAMFHFHQAGMLGAFANLIAIPLTTFVIMPVEALALALDLFGLGAPLWWVVEAALGLLLTVAHAVAAHPLAVWTLPWFSGGALAAMALGGLWFIIWRSSVRWAGVAGAVIGGAAMLFTPAPDLLVTGDGRHMAVRQPDGGMALLRGQAGDYVRDVLSGSGGNGEGRENAAALSSLENEDNARCNRDLCSVTIRKRERDWTILATRSNLYVPWRQMIDACARADIVVSDRRLPVVCAPRWLKLDRTRLREAGGVAVYLGQPMWEGVSQPNDDHPWVVGG